MALTEKRDMNKNIRLGIRWKLMLGMGTMILAVVTLLTLIQVDAQKRVLNDALETHSSFLKEQMMSRAASVSASIARHIQARIAAFDKKTTEEFIQGTVKDVDELQYVILQRSGHPIIAQGQKHNTHVIRQLLSGEASAKAADLMQTSRNEFTIGGHAFLETDVPIFLNQKVKWGTLRLAFSLDGLNQTLANSQAYVQSEIRSMISRAMMTAAGFLLVGTIIVFIYASRWTRPIRQLVRFSNDLAHGDFSAKPNIRTSGSDEIGLLVSSLEEMAVSLKSSHDQLEEYSHNLEAKVEQRTRELEEARDRAIEADKSKSEFLANMSHEIRTPINAVIGLTHLALDRESDRMQRDYLSKTLKASESLLAIINDILDFSKIEADRMELDVIDFGLEEVMHNLAGIGAVRASEKGLDFLIDCPTCMPRLKGDPYRLGQVLLNLVNNAVKFTESGQVKVSVIRLEQSDTSYRLRFEVSDTGIGMTGDQQARLFQAFSQADSSITRRFGGTGLGLAICKQLVELMDGSIGVVSEHYLGSTFYFELPFEVGATFAEDTVSIPDAVKQMHVLVVDDNADSRAIIGGYLEGFGMQVSRAESVREAVVVLDDATSSGTPPGLLMVDWTLSDSTGMASVDMIRSATDRDLPPVIVIANYGQVTSEDQVTKAGADALLFKPVTAMSLLTTLTELFDEGAAAAAQALPVDKIGHLNGARLLLVEDNPLNQVVAEGLLVKAGISLTIAHNGLQAVEAVEQESFDGVLMDMQMPVMDGLEATRRIRERLNAEDLPIIAMTANAMPQDVRRCLESGMNDHIAKPIDPADLYNKLDRWITNSRLNMAGGALPASHAGDQYSFSGLEDIEVTDGLKRVGGDAALYAQVLGKFAESHAGIGEALKQALASDDLEQAMQIAHSLAGSAGNLGADQVHVLARSIESSLKSGQMPEQGHVASLDQALKRCLNSIGNWQRSLVKADAPIQPQIVLGRDERDVVISQMREMLADYNGDAVDFLERFEQAVADVAQPADLVRLKKHLDGYDFDSALALVDTLAAKLS